MDAGWAVSVSVTQPSGGSSPSVSMWHMRNLSYREMKYFQTLVVCVVVIKSSCDPGCWLLSHSYPLQCCSLTTTPCDSHVSPPVVSDLSQHWSSLWCAETWPQGCNGLFRPLDLRVTPVGIIRGSFSSRGWGSDPLVTSLHLKLCSQFYSSFADLVQKGTRFSPIIYTVFVYCFQTVCV